MKSHKAREMITATEFSLSIGEFRAELGTVVTWGHLTASSRQQPVLHRELRPPGRADPVLLDLVIFSREARNLDFFKK